MTSPTRATVAALGALLGLAVVAFVVLYALTSDAQRPELLELVRPLVAASVAGVPAIVAAVFGVQTHRETRRQSADLETVKHQTNGELRKAVSEIVSGALDERGLVPRQRADDPPVSPHVYTYPESETR